MGIDCNSRVGITGIGDLASISASAGLVVFHVEHWRQITDGMQLINSPPASAQDQAHLKSCDSHATHLPPDVVIVINSRVRPSGARCSTWNTCLPLSPSSARASTGPTSQTQARCQTILHIKTVLPRVIHRIHSLAQQIPVEASLHLRYSRN